ncbi:MAG TPA: periplasmic heavy metal sensor [Pseudolabrys sp.]|nr:periplasmic heavy metal sensor [Pseudolabrys sp.]
MSIAQALPDVTRGSSRWLLLGSLALNLFFVGVAFAMAIRAPAPSYWDPNVFVRVDRLAATLPQADAEILRAKINTNHADIDRAQTNYHSARQRIHDVLRQEPFDVEAMRTSMAQTRAARLKFDETIQNVFADIASEISPAGRQALANWPPGRKGNVDARK